MDADNNPFSDLDVECDTDGHVIAVRWRDRDGDKLTNSGHIDTDGDTAKRYPYQHADSNGSTTDADFDPDF